MSSLIAWRSHRPRPTLRLAHSNILPRTFFAYGLLELYRYNLGLILGIALPLSLVLISFGVFIYLRRRRNRQAKDFQKLYQVEQFHVSDIRPVSAGRGRRFMTGRGNEDSEHLLTEEQPYNSIYDEKHSRDNSIVAANDVDVHRYNSLQVECVSVGEV